MKSLADLAAIKEKVKDTIILPEDSGKMRVLVGMATCGIAAGARPVMDTLAEKVKGEGLCDRVSVVQTGCIGICQYEPVVEVYEAGKGRVTYVKMTAEKAAEVFEKHIKGGEVIAEYTING